MCWATWSIDLDEDFQVTAVWNSFDHMDLKRVSIGNAKCRSGAGVGRLPSDIPRYDGEWLAA